MTTIYQHTYVLGNDNVETIPLSAEIAGNRIVFAKGENCVVKGARLNVIEKTSDIYSGLSANPDPKEFLEAVCKLETIFASQAMDRIHRMEEEVKVKTAMVQQLVEATKETADHIATLQAVISNKNADAENVNTDIFDDANDETEGESEVTVELNGIKGEPVVRRIKVKPNCRIVVRVKDGAVDEVTEEQN